MSSKYRVRRAQTVAATLVVSALAVLIIGCGGALAAEPGGRPLGSSAPQDLLARGAGYDQVAGSQRVRALQSTLRRLKHDPGPIDGLFGIRTEAAVESFQQRAGLAIDGIVGPATARALDRRGSTKAAARRSTRRDTVGRQAAQPQAAAGRGRTAAAGRSVQDPRRPPPPPGPVRQRPASGLGSVIAVVAGLALALVGLVAAVLTLRRRRRAIAGSRSANAPRIRFREPRGRTPAIATPTRSRPDRRTTSPAADVAGPPSSRTDPGDSRPTEPSTPPHSRTPSPSRADPGDGRPTEPTAPAHSHTPSKSPRGDGAPLRALGYARGDPATDVSAQAEQMERLCQRRGWTLVDLVRATEPANDGSPVPPPALERALERIGAGEAELLLVARVEQLGDSVAESAAVIDRLKSHRGQLVCLEPEIDSTTPAWDAVLQALIRFTAVIGSTARPERTGPARGRPARQSAPETASGSLHGHGLTIDPSVKTRIVAMRANGMTPEAVADRLNRDDIPPPGGGNWRPASVQAAAGANGRKPEREDEDSPTVRAGLVTTSGPHSPERSW